MNDKLLKPYNPQETEGRIYKLWEESGYFNPDNLPDRHKDYWATIMPPPNANGRLHAGHGLDMTLKDIATRFERMRGKRTLFLPGADHAGFETQVVYEKRLEKEGRSRFNMEPEELYKEILAFTLENKKEMESDVRRLGASCDWSREKFTLDPSTISKVQEVFIRMYKEGLVYRGKRIVNWCPKHQTSLSEVETTNNEEIGKFYYLKYGPFVIGTARPETKFGDKYVVVHPEDKRYAAYEHGQKFELEWINGPITATLIKDKAIDMDFGTGAMTITPWHDSADFEIKERHGLEMEQIIDWRGKLLPIAGEFAGMKIAEAREKIVEKLESKGLLERVDDAYSHVVKRCYKCNTAIEPQIRDQWFVKMAPLTEMVIDAVENQNLIKIFPDYQKKVLLHWMKNSVDWNISRQIIWGIPIPAWRRLVDTHGKQEEWQISLESPGKDWERDPDTFDTWFSSGQWPLLTLDWPNGSDFKKYYPTALMETGADLVFKWVPKMIMFGIYLAGKVPFENVYFHGMVNDAENKKMSKSKGNVISPIDMANKFGTDALRMALVVGNPPGGSTPLAEDKIKAYKHFANKLWNITRFVASRENSGDLISELKSEFDELAADITADIENYRYYLGAEKLYAYMWHRFADVIIEESKGKPEYGKTLYYILENSLKLLHPFMPFVTEEIWNILGKDKLLMIEEWPVPRAT